MSDTSVLPFLMVFAATSSVIFLGWLGVAKVLEARRAAVDRRLRPLAEETILIPSGEEDRPLTAWERLNLAFGNLMSHTGLDMDAGLAAAVILLSGVAMAAVAFVLRFEVDPWLPIPAFFVGAAGPLVFFFHRQGVWRRNLQDQLPDVFFLVSRSLRAGRGLDQAMAIVAEQGIQPLSHEFARMSHQVELGLPLANVLRAAAKRLQLVDFNVFASVVSLHRTTGGNLPLLLDRLATAARDRNQFEGQYRAATVLGRYSAALIAALALLIVLYLYFVHRDWALRFFQSGTGIALFCSAVALEIVGLLLLFWMLRTDY